MSKSAKTGNRSVVVKGLGERWRDIINWIGRQLGDKVLRGTLCSVTRTDKGNTVSGRRCDAQVFSGGDE